MSTAPATVDEYLASLPPDRRRAVEAVRDVIRRNLPAGFEEGIGYGMIAWYVPLETYPDTYNGQPLGLAALASQKRYLSLYLNNVYGNPETERWFRDRWAETGKKLDMGKSCGALSPPRGPAARPDRRDDRPGDHRRVSRSVPCAARRVAAQSTDRTGCT